MVNIIKKSSALLCAQLSVASVQASDNAPAHWDANLYKNNSIKLQYSTAMSVVDALDLQNNEVILDVGCGEGKITTQVAQRVPQGFVYAFDISQDMIHLAERDFSEQPNVAFKVGDASNFTYDVEFDRILSFFCIQWVKDKPGVFKSIHKHLKEGGQFSIVVTDRNPHLKSGREKLLAEDKWKKFFEGYEDPTNVIDNQDYETYLRDAGFKDFKILTENKYVHFDSYEGLKSFVRMVTAHINKLPIELKDEFIELLMQHYMSQVPEHEGSKHYIMYKTFFISGRK